MKQLVVILTLFIAVEAQTQSGSHVGGNNEDGAGDVTAQPLAYVMCRQNKDVRTIRISREDAKNCITTYTKEGMDQQIAKSSRRDICADVLENVKTNLEKANWKCKDISGKSSVTSEVSE